MSSQFCHGNGSSPLSSAESLASSTGWDDDLFAEFAAADEGLSGDRGDLDDEFELNASIDKIRGLLAQWSGDPSGSAVPKDTSRVAPRDAQRAAANPAVPSLSGAVPETAAEEDERRFCVNTSGLKPEELAELREAFLEDASRGVASMEQAILDFESSPRAHEPLRQVCHELHTLKSASAIAGLPKLSRFLHDAEDYLELAHLSSEQRIIARVMLGCVDAIRQQMECFGIPAELSVASLIAAASMEGTEPHPEPGQLTDDGREAQAESASRKAPSRQRLASEDGEGSRKRSITPEQRSDAKSNNEAARIDDGIRVKAAQLDRLMDMLAELVMLRNRRDSHVNKLRALSTELTRSTARLRMLEADFQSNSEEGVRKHTMRLPAFSETVGDLSEIGRALRETFEPMGEENQAITRFIRQFRQELVNLVRTPMSGLFRRLQRAIADAARVEGKRVRVEIIDADVGLERSVQERLLDPLLHIVRNSVGHGIETEEERRRAGKDPVGRITIETQGKPNLLVLTISDDGRGLDYDALRRRGLELGLLRGDRDASPQELAQLIFHAGFSTRKTANSVAGRGVGMDIVATTLDQMRSWVEVDSRPGDGTRVRITVPLRSIIDHAMVVRAAGQLFALPIPFVRTASPAADGDTRAVPLPAYPLQQLLGRPVPPLTSQSELIVDIKPFVNTETLDAAAGDKQEAASFTVDEIIGPEEVVIRPLPPLLRHQSLFTGITLSGDGELVLVMDPRRLVEFATGQVRAKTPCVPAEEPQTHILVVDDSLSSRRSVSFALRRHNLRGLEVADGAAALEAFARHDIRAVITDYEMPGMDGLVLLQRLRERLGPRFPLVMMTSCRLESVKAQAEALGVLRFLRKPLVPEELDQAIVRIHQEMGATNRL